MKLLLVGIFILFASLAYSQDATIEILRSDLKSNKLKIMIASMEMPEAASKKFWPIYKEYDAELSKIGDKVIANIKDYAEHATSMTDDKADELITKGFKNREGRLDLLKKYYKKVKKELGASVAARFIQTEMQILTLIDAKINEAVPLVKIPK